MTSALTEVLNAVDRIGTEIGDILQVLPEDLTIGDDGVVELVVRMENTISSLQGKLRRKYDERTGDYET